jgi:hypothetical protein
LRVLRKRWTGFPRERQGWSSVNRNLSRAGKQGLREVAAYSRIYPNSGPRKAGLQTDFTALEKSPGSLLTRTQGVHGLEA